MGLFDSIKAQATAILTGAGPEADGGQGLAGVVIEVVRQHGLGDLVQKLQKGGLKEAVASWVGTGANLPVTAEQLEGALGPDTIAKLAGRVGLSPEQATALLAQVLPHAVDHLTPNGTVEDARPAPGADEAAPESDPSAEPETEPTER